MTNPNPHDGTRDLRAAAESLSARLPDPLRPLASLAYNYWWSWAPGGRELFLSIDAERWSRCGNNPVQLLEEVSVARLRTLAADGSFVDRLAALNQSLLEQLARPSEPMTSGPGHVAFFCAEFGIHHSLPFYAGGLGVLAGDYLKEASDRAAPVVGIGLFYSQGSFHQRLDTSGWQHEFWLDTDSGRLPAALVTSPDGTPLSVEVRIRGRSVRLRIWRVDVGRVPLYLLDTNHPANAPADRWITARLYVGSRELRLAQYAVLGIGGVRALRAMGVDTALVHLNEGHAALALSELLREGLQDGLGFDESLAQVRSHTRFTTHTPVAAGNESFGEDQLRDVLPDLATEIGIDWNTLISLARVRPGDGSEGFGLTPLALRLSGTANGVSRLHGSVARSMWHGIWPDQPVDAVPIKHVSNGVHLPTWMAPEMSALLSRHLPDWSNSPAGPGSWNRVHDIPDEDLWELRCQLRRKLAGFVRDRSVRDRLGRGESVAFSEAAAEAWSDDVLTVGFARRIATYKRLYLITRDPARGLRLLNGDQPMQLLIAGRAHPQDDEAKRTVQQVFALRELSNVGARVVFLEDYDLAMAARLVQGCDLWINLPRLPQEASGTSGMKVVVNGGLHLSVLDGWWAEAYQPGNGWAIESDVNMSWEEQDQRDAARLFDLLEYEVLPLFYDRDSRGIPLGWMQMVKASMAAHGPRFSATRMLRDYAAGE